MHKTCFLAVSYCCLSSNEKLQKAVVERGLKLYTAGEKYACCELFDLLFPVKEK